MMVLWRLFLDIVLFKKGPQDVPDSPVLFALVLLADVVISTVVGALEGDVSGALVQAFVASVLLLAFVALILLLTSHRERFQKTATAVLGCDALMTLAALPVSLLSDVLSGLGLLIMGILFWNLLVFAHILKHALGIGYALSVALALIFTLTSLDLMARIFA
ncbi:MAG TPA: hypothetical protein DCY52_03650 [Methylococcaceae bacterium]|jgi:hypothetical protein|nr:hypothetical protein [Methylococcaceae bacterium]